LKTLPERGRLFCERFIVEIVEQARRDAYAACL
jgi:hypothetical protein